MFTVIAGLPAVLVPAFYQRRWRGHKQEVAKDADTLDTCMVFGVGRAALMLKMLARFVGQGQVLPFLAIGTGWVFV